MRLCRRNKTPHKEELILCLKFFEFQTRRYSVCDVLRFYRKEGRCLKIYVPDYYEHFKCIADKCRHSCCIGWEIDIDDYTMKIYDSIGGELGGKLRSNINVTSDGARFILDKNERCPFLCENGLCELILEKGEDILCDICTDHPRFRNFYSDRIEMGLGLCCEAAAVLILGNQRPMNVVL